MENVFPSAVTSWFQLHITVFNYLLSFLESHSTLAGKGLRSVLAQTCCSSRDKVTEVQWNEATCPAAVSSNVGKAPGPSHGEAGPSASPVVKSHFDNLHSGLTSEQRPE